LALVSLMRFFDARDITIEGRIRAHLQDDQGTAFEEFVLIAMTKLLQNGRALKDIFEFYGRDPDWARCKAQVVSQRVPNDFRPFDNITHEPTIPSAGVAFCAKTPEDVKEWITGNHQAGWCVPGPRMGPDIMTWLQLDDGRHLLLVVQVKCYLSGNRYTIPAEVTADAIRSLVPARFFSSVTSANTDEQKEALKTVTEALEAINEPLEAFTKGQYNILRVIVAYPLEADLESSSEKVEAALRQDKHTLARLSRSALLAAVATNPRCTSVLNMLVQSLKRKRDQADLDRDAKKHKKPHIS